MYLAPRRGLTPFNFAKMFEDTAPVLDVGRHRRPVCQVWTSYALPFGTYEAFCVWELLRLWPWPLTFWLWNWCAILRLSCGSFQPILVFLRLSVLELWTDTRQNGHVTLWAWGFILEDTAPQKRYKIHSFSRLLIESYRRPSVISNDLEWLSKLFNDTKRRAVSATAVLIVVIVT